MATLTVCVFFRDFKTWIFNKQDEKSERDCAVCAFFYFFIPLLWIWPVNSHCSFKSSALVHTSRAACRGPSQKYFAAIIAGYLPWNSSVTVAHSVGFSCWAGNIAGISRREESWHFGRTVPLSSSFTVGRRQICRHRNAGSMDDKNDKNKTMLEAWMCARSFLHEGTKQPSHPAFHIWNYIFYV